MSCVPLNPAGGRARLIAAKVPAEDAEWFDALIERSGPGTTQSAVLRQIIALARKHEEELKEAS